ncbi:hypothetical protein NP493_1920g00007 [Ridgeia piscesae]|uniref:Uncharacterized protein n=1 Tax=Ridgeia piscesae TaxID=27915 RepID=A0AAD9JPG7_RIDPI|nr:hypothetical protein NP493_1920g00007 [Ridgeia piscesae]
MRNKGSIANKHPFPHDSCRNFEHYQNSVTLKGEVLRKVGEGVVPSLCTQACLDTSDFVCAAALIQLPSTCFVTGYRLRDDYYSKHYYRVCASGSRAVHGLLVRHVHPSLLDGAAVHAPPSIL